ncbi:MAG: VanZ family protein [Pseudomonadota bacterium]
MPALLQLCCGVRYQAWRLRAAFLLYGAILVLGSLPGARAALDDVASGLILHSLAYGGLSALVFTGRSGSALGRALGALASVMLMGAIDETLQSFFPYRHATLGDWLVDCGAAGMTALLLWACWPRLARAAL